MIPIVFINCSSAPFIDMIIDGRKIAETRTSDTLGSLVGKRVLLAETGRGAPVVRCYATIKEHCKCTSEKDWRHSYWFYTGIEPGSKYDWNDKTTVKHLYKLTDVSPVPAPFTPPEGKRHGRVWMEYDGPIQTQNNTDRMVTVESFIEIFEDFLEEKNIDIPNPEKDDDPCASTIYGTDYGILESRIESLLISLNVL